MKTPKSLIPLAALALAATACATSVEPDQVGLEYNAGAFSDTKFDECIKPGTRAWSGPGDKVFVYPGGQRTYEFSGNKDSADTGPIEVVSKDNLTMTVSGVATFSLNGDCKTLRQFHERIGLKYKADTDDGWTKVLATYLRQPLDRVMDQASKEHNWQDLYANPESKKAWETKVGELIVQQVNTLAGGPFFCAPTYAGAGDCGAFSLTLQQPIPPQNVQNALAQAQQAVQDNETQKNQNKKIDTELEAIKKLTKVLGPYGAILYQAIKDGKITVVPVPQGSSLNIGGTP